jgi:hypothetical protein
MAGVAAGGLSSLDLAFGAGQLDFGFLFSFLPAAAPQRRCAD